MRLHVTDLLMFGHCEARAYWSVVRRLRKPYDGAGKPIGSAVHRGLELLYRGQSRSDATISAVDYYKELTPLSMRRELEGEERAKVEIGEIQVTNTLRAYPWGPKDEFEVAHLIEEPLSARLGEHEIVGTVDRIVKTNGGLYIHDTKTTGLSMSMASKTQKLSMQYPAYMWLAKENGYDVKGVVVELIQKPRVYKRKDGSFSCGNPGYHREPVVLTFAEIDRWVSNAERYCVIADTASPDTLNTQACLTYMRPCPYFDLCMNPRRAEQVASVNYREVEER